MARGVNRFGSMAAFAGHRTGGGGAGSYLKDWKKAGSYDAWLHTKVLPVALWIHKIPKVVVVEDKKTKVKTVHVWGDQCVCHETETVLGAQYQRDKDTGIRKNPPKRCGLCKLVEWCYQQCVLFEEFREENEKFIAAKKFSKVKGIRFTSTLFKFVGDVPEETQVIHIGGFCGIFDKDMNDKQTADLAASKIVVGGKAGAWRENGHAKCHYMMAVVNHNAPEDGVKIAIETSALGNAVKSVLNAVLEEDNRNIEDDPYVIRWKFNPNASMSEMYDAVPMRKLKPTPRILQLIKGKAPIEEMERKSECFNQQVVRAFLEKHCVEKYKSVIPWDELFPSPEQEKKWALEDAAEEAAAEAEEVGDDEDIERDADGNELFACTNEKCDAKVKASDKTCPKCGEEFDVEDEGTPATEEDDEEEDEEEEDEEEEDEEEEDEEEEDEEEEDEEEEDEEEEEKPAPKAKSIPTRAEHAAKKKAASKKKAKPSDDDEDQGSNIPF